MLQSKPGVQLRLVNCKLRDAEYYSVIFWRNMMFHVCDAGRDSSRIEPMAGVIPRGKSGPGGVHCIDDGSGHDLHSFYGDKSRMQKCLPGDEPIQLCLVDSYIIPPNTRKLERCPRCEGDSHVTPKPEVLKYVGEICVLCHDRPPCECDQCKRFRETLPRS